MTRTRLATVVGAAMAAVLTVVGLALSLNGQDRVAGWRGDVDHLVAEARRIHAGPARPAHSAAFGEAAADLARRVPDLSDHRVAVELQGLMARLADGHSLVYPVPSPRMAFAMLPVEIYFFADGLYVVDGTGPAQGLAGSRILRFGDRSTADVVRAMTPYVSRDNEMGVKAFGGLYLVIPAFLEAWGAAHSPDRATLTIVDAAGETRSVTLDAGPARRVRRRLAPPPSTSEPVPLYLRHTGSPYHVEWLPDHRALYFQFNEVTNAPGRSLARLAADLGEELATRGAKYLIVDVRHNHGGDNTLLEPLLAAIAGFAAASPEHHTYVLTGRSTFSAAQNFINRLERRVPALTFAGEPSMSSPNFTGEDNPVVLPFSGLNVSISSRYWQDSDAGDLRPWIAPHIPVALTSRDWLANRDPVLEAVLRAIGERR